MKENEIQLGTGISNIYFGFSIDQVKDIMGEPEEIEESDEDDEFEHRAFNYWEKGYSFFFDREDDYRLSCIQTEDDNVQLFNVNVIQKSTEEIKDLLQKNNLKDYETEKLETGELRWSFEQEMLDLYFEDDKLIAINFGVFINDDLEVQWPSEGLA
ncbi:hypothetical protein [Adhaeribacter pallidiroseus]|uniref:Uncharacterized protein n=1 Tax=Adhaeribacter pallidiroseus TaxID=2072847 RepID=A0A369QU26_9BACT|nr:hypothetical protein [Adhaeribacter pallidiroseus]RDC65668.1 hypothetical protein AHMF7616_04298 [Adhaeribacter pallidiroseus]